MKKIIEVLEDNLIDHPRFIHSCEVGKMALKLNEMYHLMVDENKIIIASLLHDVTKPYTKEEQIEILNSNFLNELSPEFLNSPAIWHAFTGSIVARDEYDIDDEEILNAIKYHTTGRPAMTNLEKLIYLSDFIEEGRIGEHFLKVREIAYNKGLNEAIVAMYENEFDYLNKNKQEIYPLSLKAYEYYKKEVNND